MDEQKDVSFDISEYPFGKPYRKQIAANHWVIRQWPLVYFIRNHAKKIAYVGESTNGLSRIDNHLADPDRALLNTISIIGSDLFNKSATLDIESQLIQHLAAEGTFELQNGNNGLSHHNYYQQKYYSDMFSQIWERLMQEQVVHRALRDIQNSDLFKYSPYKSLNPDQFEAVLDILGHLNQQTANHIFVTGSAGTGKTILATYLVKLLTSRYEELNTESLDEEARRELELVREFRKKYPNPTIGLVVAMESLRSTLQTVFAQVPGLKKSMVIGPADTFKKKYDILIVDEAHRLRQRKNIVDMQSFTRNNEKLGLGNEGTQLDWIMANSRYQVFFYDPEQTVRLTDVPQQRFDALIRQNDAILLPPLKSQMRVAGGADYITFVDELLNVKIEAGSQPFRSDNYELAIYDSLPELYADLRDREERYTLCRLIAGYSWKWQSNKDPNATDIEIDGMNFRWNTTGRDWINSPDAFREIGCIHTTQGYDLNYAGVIFGKEITYNPVTGKIEILAEHYHDTYGKRGINDPELLKQYVVNIYKNMLYRGIRGTFVYAVDENLRKYLERYILPVSLRTRGAPAVRLSPSKPSAGLDSWTIVSHAQAKPYKTHVPFYDLQIAAGPFTEAILPDDHQWITLPPGHKPMPGLFVCRVTGESMNKVIPNGSLCLFREDAGGSRQGKIVVVQHADLQDPDCAAGFTVKRYFSEKRTDEDGWRHERIVLRPESTDAGYADIVLEADEAKGFRVLGVFVGVVS